MSKFILLALSLVVTLLIGDQPVANKARVPKPPDPWFCTVFRNCIPDDPGWVPDFALNPKILSPFAGATQPANPWYFATLDTAQKTCVLLNCGGIYEQKPCNVGGGPVECSHAEYILKFPTGNKNAGFMAAFVERNPLNWFPGVALQRMRDDMLK